MTNVTASDFVEKPIKLPASLRQRKKTDAKAKKQRFPMLARKLLGHSRLKQSKRDSMQEKNPDLTTADIHVALAAQEVQTPIQGWFYEMEGAAQACVTRYCELADCDEKPLKKFGTPCMDDHLLPPEDFVTQGVLSAVCSQAVLKCLYMTRLARPELYWTVNSLARCVTKWTVACDKRLYRLISFIHYNKTSVIRSWVGDKPRDCKLMLFCDASFAGDLVGSKSTSGVLLCLVSNKTFCPITWLCKKQSATSHSSTEAELIALDAGLRLEGLPAMTLWDLILNVLDPDDSVAPNITRAKTDQLLPAEMQELMNVDYVPCNVPTLSKRCKLIIMEDNDAVIKMCKKVRAPTMRHVPRTHRIDVDTLLERIHGDKGISIKYVNTKLQIADIFTKGSFSVQTWNDLCNLLQVGPIDKTKEVQPLEDFWDC